MDEECAEVLGRPISSMKVTDLRDELAKRGLIKTGNKKELIDRLRADIQKHFEESNSSAPVVAAANPPLEQTINPDPEPESHDTPEQVEQLPVDQHQTQNEPVDQGDVEIPQEVAGPGKVLDQEQQLSPETQEVEEAQTIKGTQANLTTKVGEEHQESADEPTGDAEKAQESLTEITGLESIQVDPNGEAYIDPDNDSARKSNQDDALSKEQVTQESEPAAPVTFTLKRGVSDVKDSADPNKAEKRRRWSSKTDQSPPESVVTQTAGLSGGISSQKLKELIDIKQLEQTKTSKRDQSKKAEAKRDPSKSTDKASCKKDDDDETEDKQSSGKSNDQKPDAPSKGSAKESVPDRESSKLEKRVKDPTNGLLIMHLVRPFTVSQLKEELTKFGPINEEKFWTNKVKSKCCVLYESIDAARQTKDTLHGQHWPASNPKTLQISYITEEEYENLITFDELKKSGSKGGAPVNGNDERSNKVVHDRLKVSDDIDEANNVVPMKRRLGEKIVSADASSESGLVNRSGDHTQSQELDDLFKKTKSKPPLFWLPLSEQEAEARQKARKERQIAIRDATRKVPSRRSPASRHRSPHARRSPPRHRSPNRSQARHRSPISRRSPPRRRSPLRESPPLRRRSSLRESPQIRRRSPIRNSPPTRRRSPRPPRRSPDSPRRMLAHRDSPINSRRSPNILRRSPGPIRRSPAYARRSPGLDRRSRSPIRRSPVPVRLSPGISRRSPELSRRSPGLIRRSPGPIRRSPVLSRRSPGPNRRSPDIVRRSPGPIRRSPVFNRRSPGPVRRSPGPIRRSPGPIRSPILGRRSPVPIRRSPGPIRRSPGPIRRSPGPIRRSPGPVRRSSPGPIRRSPESNRRSPRPMRRSPGLIRRSPGAIRRSPGPIRRSPGPIRRSPGPIRRSPGPIRRDRFDRR